MCVCVCVCVRERERERERERVTDRQTDRHRDGDREIERGRVKYKILRFYGIESFESKILFCRKMNTHFLVGAGGVTIIVDLLILGPIELFLVNKGRSMCYPVSEMVHIKDPLLLIEKRSPCGGSGFLSCSVIIYHMSGAK